MHLKTTATLGGIARRRLSLPHNAAIIARVLPRSCQQSTGYGVSLVLLVINDIAILFIESDCGNDCCSSH